MESNLKTEENGGLRSVEPTPWSRKDGGGLEMELELIGRAWVGFKQQEAGKACQVQGTA